MAEGPVVDPLVDPMYAEYLEEAPVVHKKHKLTPAEKLEKKKQEERDFKMLEMRVNMEREYKMSKNTARKHQERWENMCQEVKLKEMKSELEEWEKKTDRVIKQKDEKIERVLDEIAITEEIHKKSFSNQLQTMDYLLDIWKTFQDTSQLLYEKEVSDLLHDFYQECEFREKFESDIKLNCENVVHNTELLIEHEMLSDYKIYLDKRDDRVNTEIEKRYRLRDSILVKMKHLRKQLMEFINSLLNVSLDAQKYERINSLMERQRNFLTESQKLNNVEAKSNRIYDETHKELMMEDRESKRVLNDLKLEHDYFLQMRKKIENAMKSDREQTYEKMKIITSESFVILKHYQKLRKFGELLLSLAANCRKFQTESEKILPWGDFQEARNENEIDNEPFILEVIDLKKHVDVSEAELQKSAQLMKHFWRRQALAEAQIVLLEDKKEKLLNENQKYIDTIKRLSKTDNAEDLKETLEIKSAIEPDLYSIF